MVGVHLRKLDAIYWSNLNRNMRNLILDSFIIVLAILLTGSTAFAMQPATTKEVHAEQKPVASVEVSNKAPEPKDDPTPEPKIESAPVALETVKIEEPKPAPVAPVAQDNETIVWNYLINQGFSRNQTAGIMGNLQQEHGFKTSGDGLAQWLGNRKANLMARENPYDINTQVAFLVEELRGTEIRAYNAIMANDSVENSTIAFQNLFERCNPQYCMQSQRIAYAYAILNRH